MELSKRIEKLIEYSGLSIPKFAVRVGFKTPQAVRELLKGNTKTLSYQAQEKILASFPEVSSSWLLSGDGEMLTSQPSQPMASHNEKLIPVRMINLDSKGGTNGYNDIVQSKEYTTGYYLLPSDIAKEGDLLMPVYGDSMSPTYVSGSMVLIRPVPLWREYLEFGATYVLALEDDRRIIKEIRKGADDDHYLLASINPQFEDSEISKNIIRSVWRVIMSVRRESL